ncbi:hypothetical protein CALCODRAFT_309836 [Calocera cornea HHB12733]|uniref:RNase III domain-containing protein n=1 Tax=Calocera cornea HHB12733 TaxID=1353952 RepID=A0A165FHN4_9BASI|nr:hypothetical protein CALCODRAFT_309836 [Calocera cornea HHB12733]
MQSMGIWNVWANASNNLTDGTIVQVAPTSTAPLPTPSAATALVLRDALPVAERDTSTLDITAEKKLLAGLQDKQRSEEYNRAKVHGRALIKAAILAELGTMLPDVPATILERKATKALLVHTFLANVATELDFPTRIAIATESALTISDSLLAEAFQAFVGAMFVENGNDMAIIHHFCRKAFSNQLPALASADVVTVSTATKSLGSANREHPDNAKNQLLVITSAEQSNTGSSDMDNNVVTDVSSLYSSQQGVLSARTVPITPPGSEGQREAQGAAPNALQLILAKPAGARPTESTESGQNASMTSQALHMAKVSAYDASGGDKGHASGMVNGRDKFPTGRDLPTASSMFRSRTSDTGFSNPDGTFRGLVVYERPVPNGTDPYLDQGSQPRGQLGGRAQNVQRKRKQQRQGPPELALRTDGLSPDGLRARDGLPPRKRKGDGKEGPHRKRAKTGLQRLEGDKLRLDDYMRKNHPQVDISYKPYGLFSLGKPSNGIRNIEIPLQIGAPFNITVTGVGPTAGEAEENAATQALARVLSTQMSAHQA